MAKGTNSSALKHYERGRQFLNHHTRAFMLMAQEEFELALEEDPNFWQALGDIAYVHLVRYQDLLSDDPDEELRLAEQKALVAKNNVPDDYYNLWGYAMVLHAKAGAAEGQGQAEQSDKLLNEAIAAYDLALKLNKSDPGLLVLHADLLAYLGRASALKAAGQIRRAMRMNPDHPDWYFWCEGAALFHAHEYGQSVIALSSMIKPEPRVPLHLAASYARLSETVEGVEADEFLALAKHELQVAQQMTPAWTLDRERQEKFARPEDKQHWIGALELAGAANGRVP